MSGARRHAAALSGPDARPLGPDDFTRMERTPQVKIIRRALGLSQEEFSARFHIRSGLCVIGSRDARHEIAAARAYLVAIGRPPKPCTTPRTPRRDPQ
jgi:putative transcriptional regulator